ncbi:uncharacterized protein LOC124656036 [Lolium rigidum]|uniref:uncharacterized protein LOC124656036 n=1 Tax=Lolium rigidum TaxID=89674 RepID=UPI001F5CBAEE|nr:uncharacterized protein LOC124656036 [Lolium rigidum]
MAAGCVITEECGLAVSADRMWKVACAGDNKEALLKACAGFIEAVDVEGDGGPGSVTTLTLSPAAAAKAGACVIRTCQVARDDAARVLRTDVLEGGKVSAQLKSQVVEARLEADGEGACVAKSSFRLTFLQKLRFQSLVGWKNYLVIEFVMMNPPGDAGIIAANCIQ